MRQAVWGVIKNNRIVISGIFGAVFFWFAETFLHTFLTHENTFMHQLLNPSAHELWMRMVMVSLFVFFSIHCQLELNRKKTAQRMLEISEGKYFAIAEMANDGVAIVQEELFIYVNKAFSGFTGYRVQELIGMNFMNVVPLDQKNLVMERHTARLTGKETPPVYQTSLIAKDKSLKDVEVSAAVIEINAKPATLVLFRDITERKKIEKEIKENEERYRLISENISDSIWIMDMDQNFTYLSPSTEKMFGFSISEMTAGKLEGRLTPESYAFAVDTFRKELERDREPGIEKNRSVIFELEQYHKKGHAVWTEITASFLRNPEGRAIAVVGVTRDITDRKYAERSLQAERDKLKVILAGLGDAIAIINRGFDIETHNYQFNNFFGSAVNKKCHDMFFGRDRPCFRCPIINMDGDSSVRYNEFVTRDGRYFETTLSQFTDIDGNRKVVMLIKNITQKKKMEAESIRIDRLATIGELAAGVAHEINNPITGVINYSELLKDHLKEWGVDSDIPDRIIREGERIAAIVKNLLSFARDRREPLSAVWITTILENTLALIHKQILNEGITIRLNIPSGIPAVKAKGQELQQVFLNIINNARYALNRKFPGSDKNKLLEIHCEIINTEDKKYVRTVIYDRGTGIPTGFQDKICNPFFTTKPVGEGMGLGLSICHGIIIKYNGGLFFESREHEYTKVFIDIPVYEDVD